MSIIDKIRKKVIKICEKDYKSYTDGRYYIIRGKSASQVRNHILKKLPPELSKMKYLNMGCVVVDVNGNAFVEII